MSIIISELQMRVNTYIESEIIGKGATEKVIRNGIGEI